MTPTVQLIEIRLGGSLTDFVLAQRALGLGWRKVADALFDRTGIRVSHEFLRMRTQADASGPRVQRKEIA